MKGTSYIIESVYKNGQIRYVKLEDENKPTLVKNKYSATRLPNRCIADIVLERVHAIDCWFGLRMIKSFIIRELTVEPKSEIGTKLHFCGKCGRIKHPAAVIPKCYC